MEQHKCIVCRVDKAEEEIDSFTKDGWLVFPDTLRVAAGSHRTSKPTDHPGTNASVSVAYVSVVLHREQ